MARVPFTISNQSATFYVKGRPYSLTKDQAEYAGLKAALQREGDHDVEELLSFTDVRRGLLRASHGQMQIIGDDIVWQGQALHNVWVDRIFEFKAAGEPFDVLWLALQRLVKNPTREAIERLPNFLERCKLGFLPDGRFAAFKGVRGDYMDCHSRTFSNRVGDVCMMAREAVDPNPNQTCSRGLHVGAPGYVSRYYGSSDRKVMLVAVAPEDVVAVPTDYQGEKMRVCRYEVIDEVDDEYRRELLGCTGTVLRGYEPPAPPAAPFDITDVKVGDVVSYAGDDADPAGNYTVIEYDSLSTELTLKGEREGVWTWLYNDKVTGIVERAAPAVEDEDDVELTAAQQAKVGDYVEYESVGETYAGRVLEVDDQDETNRLRVADLTGAGYWIVDDEIIRVIPAAELTGAMVAIVGDKVDLVNDPLIRDGHHEITETNDEDGGGQFDPHGYTFMVNVNDVQSVAIRNDSIARVYRNSALVWPALAEGVSMTKDDAGNVHLTSVAGVDLRDVEVREVAADAPVVLPPDLQAQVGDLVTTMDGGWPPAGTYPVIRIDEGSEEFRVVVQTEHDGEQAVRACYVALLTPRPWMRAEIGGTVDLRGTGETGQAYRNGGRGIEVLGIHYSADLRWLIVRTPAGPQRVVDRRVIAAYPKA